jgi:hypothetical protein
MCGQRVIFSIKPILRLFSAFLLISLNGTPSFALTVESASDQAWSLHNRLTGVPPKNDVLENMTYQILLGRPDLAAFEAMNSSYFYTTFLIKFFSPDSNRSKKYETDLNDFLTTIAGMIYNNRSFKEILTGDYIYAGSRDIVDFDNGTDPLIQRAGANPTGGEVTSQPAPTDQTKIRALVENQRFAGSDGLRARIRYNSNDHFNDLQQRYPFNWHTKLELFPHSQVLTKAAFDRLASGPETKIISSWPQGESMGVLMTRKAATEFFMAGTNRRVIDAVFDRFLCSPLETLRDSDLPDDRIRRDIDRLPAGDPNLFQTSCRSCHAGMDGLTGGLTFLDFRGDLDALFYDPAWPAFCGSGDNSDPRCKQVRQASVFPQGHVQTNNSFVNYWTLGRNASLGWRSPEGMSASEGQGANQLARVIAETEAFSNCMSKRVFHSICGRDPTDQENGSLAVLSREIEMGFSEYSGLSAASPYNFRALVAKISSFCFGKE